MANTKIDSIRLGSGSVYDFDLPRDAQITISSITADTANLSVINCETISSLGPTQDLSLYNVRIYTNSLSNSNYVWFEDNYIAVGIKREPPFNIGKSNQYYFPGTKMPGEDGGMTQTGVTYYKLASQDDIKPLYLHTIKFKMNYSTGGGTTYKNYDFYGAIQIINYSSEHFTTSTLNSYVLSAFGQNTNTALNVSGYIYLTQNQTSPRYYYYPVVQLEYNAGPNQYTASFIDETTLSSTTFTHSSVKNVVDSVREISKI